MVNATSTQFDPTRLDGPTRFRYDTLVDAIAVNEREGTPHDDYTFTRLREMLAAIENGQTISRVAESAAAKNPERKPGGTTGANQYGAYKVRSASPGQLRYIALLLSTKRVPAKPAASFARSIETYQADNGSLSVKAATDLIDWLNTLDQAVAPAQATDKQVASIRREATRRKITPDQEAQVDRVVAELDAGRPVARKTASDALDILFNAPFKPRKVEPANDGLTDGMYQLADGTVYKVQIAKQGSGRLYAKRLRIQNENGTTQATFEYEPDGISRLSLTDKMSLEAAKAFGKLYGICCNCAAELTDERSIEAGIGPICAKRF